MKDIERVVPGIRSQSAYEVGRIEGAFEMLEALEAQKAGRKAEIIFLLSVRDALLKIIHRHHYGLALTCRAAACVDARAIVAQGPPKAG